MILSIQNNLMAKTTYRNLQKAGATMGKAMEQLSSGYRINTASDGPADLVMSEQLRARIEGLERAIRNVKESSNVLDITEGALGEVQNILRNMQKLTLRAMNSGVTSKDQIAADQAELDAGLQAIDRIMGTTNYAGRKLLDNLNLGGNLNTGTPVVNGKKLDDAAAEQKSNVPPRTGADVGELIFKPGEAAPPVNTDPLFDENGLLLSDKTFTIHGRDGDPESVETVSFSEGAGIDEIVAKLREYAIAPEQAAGLDPDYAEPSGRQGRDINTVDLDLDTLAHIQNMDDASAATFLTGYMTNFRPEAIRLDSEQIDLSKLTEGERKLYELSQHLQDMSMNRLGSTLISMGYDKNGMEVFKEFTLDDLYSGGGASLAEDPDAAMSVIKSAISDIAAARAQIGATKKYAHEAEENVLYAELESYTRCESYLRDTDMASAMVDYTRSKIISEMGTRLLKTANESAMSILDLMV